MNKLKIFLGKNTKTSFTINLLDNIFVKKWIKELQWCLTNCEYDRGDMFVDFLSADTIRIKLKTTCDAINNFFKNFIEIKKEYTQEYLNYLHVCFEKLSGDYGQPTRLFLMAPTEIKRAIRDLNFLVHALEKKSTSKNLYISFNKDQYRRHPLDKIDYEHFEFVRNRGSLYLAYAELGKTLNELYKDKLPFDYKGKKNLHFYSGESFLHLSNDYDILQEPGYKEWLKENDIDPFDKSLGHGVIKLGYVDDVEDVIKKIENNQYLQNIELF